MDGVLNFIGQVGTAVLPIFVFLTMFNVGINRVMSDFTEYVDEWPFFLRMIVINLVVAPIIMWLMLQVVSLSEPLEVGLLIFSMVAGAPFVIKLTQYSEHDLVLGATLLIVLIVGTCVIMPLTSSFILPDIGALGTGQRNTAAGMILATTNFAYTLEILLIITIGNTMGIILLIMIAKYLSKDNQKEITHG